MSVRQVRPGLFKIDTSGARFPDGTPLKRERHRVQARSHREAQRLRSELIRKRIAEWGGSLAAQPSVPPPTPTTLIVRSAVTLTRFWQRHYLPWAEQVAMDQENTLKNKRSIWSNHLCPLFGNLPITAMGPDWETRLQTYLADSTLRREAADGCRHHLTLKGGALAGASAAKPFSRKAADKALAGFVQRCHEVRERDEFVLKVGTAWLFGSMLTDKPKVGDVDIAVFLAVKAQHSENLGHVMWARAAEAGRNGRRFSSYFERSTYVHQCVLRHLKSRSRILKLCDHNDGVLDLCEKKIVYQDPDCEPPSSTSG